MVRRFTDIAEKLFRAVRCQVAGLFTVVANNSMASVRVVPGLMTMAASARLTFVSEVDQNFSKAHVVGDRTFNSHSVMADTILHIFPSRFSEIATAGTHNITIFGKTVDDRRIRHFVRRIKNLKISEWTVNIL